jgi:DnaB-like helicase N terminal domain
MTAIESGSIPRNIEAEQCLLGAILISNGVFASVDPIVSGDDFFESLHRDIYSACSALIANGRVASPITLKAALPADLDVAGLTVRSTWRVSALRRPRSSMRPTTPGLSASSRSAESSSLSWRTARPCSRARPLK